MKTAFLGSMAMLGVLAAGASAENPALVPPPEAPEEQPGEDFAQVAIDPDRYQRMTVPVTIGGSGPYRFLVDTGAEATVLTPKILSDLNLEPTGNATLVAMGSRREVQTIDIDGLEFANRKLNNLTAPLLKDRHIGADGILGLDTLQDMRVLIDFREDSMSVADARDLGGNRGYEIVVRARRKLGQMIITDAKIDGIRTSIIIDTGAQSSHGNAVLRRKLRARSQETLMTMDVNGVAYQSDLTFARSLEISGVTLTQVPIGFSESPVFKQLGLDDRPTLILGMQNLRVFERVAIDFAQRRILFDVPAGVASEQLKKRVFFPTRIGTS